MNEGAREANEEIFRNSVLNKFDQIIAHNKEADESEQTIAQLRAALAERDKELEEARKVIELADKLLDESMHDSYYSTCAEYNEQNAIIDKWLAAHPVKP